MASAEEQGAKPEAAAAETPSTKAPSSEQPAPAQAQAQAAPAEEAPALSAPAEKVVPVAEVVYDEAFYGLAVDPEGSFAVGKGAAAKMHAVFDALRAEGAGGSGGGAEQCRELQLGLLQLRRAHRAMGKLAETNRALEAAARRTADSEHAHMETRRFESASRAAAAQRCRSSPTPALDKLREVLDTEGVDSGEEREKDDANGVAPSATPLGQRLEAERLERVRLEAERAALETQAAGEQEAFRVKVREGETFAEKLRAAARAFEPVCDLIELRSRPEDARPTPASVQQLPTPLRLVYNKFDVLSSFGKDAGIRLEVDPLERPPPEGASPEKRARRDGAAVVVAVARKPGEEAAGEVKLSFALAPASGADVTSGAVPSLVAVACKGHGAEALVDGLWSDDDGRSGMLAASRGPNTEGRFYGWAQVLAGLRDVAAPLTVDGAGPLTAGLGVSAADVVQRLRQRGRA